MTEYTIEPFDATYHQWAHDFLTETWGGVEQVSRGVLYNVLEYPGFVAVVDGAPQGLVTYRIDIAQCEIMMIHSAIEGIGVGAALIEQVQEVAREAKCKRLWLVTTNDNIPAIRWYQRRGFSLAKIHVKAVKRSRKLKPEIPKTGFDGIPIRDEIEFEMEL